MDTELLKKIWKRLSDIFIDEDGVIDRINALRSKIRDASLPEKDRQQALVFFEQGWDAVNEAYNPTEGNGSVQDAANALEPLLCSAENVFQPPQEVPDPQAQRPTSDFSNAELFAEILAGEGRASRRHTELSNNLSTVKTDLSTVKDDLRTVKADLSTVKADLETVTLKVSKLEDRHESLGNDVHFLRSQGGVRMYAPQVIRQSDSPNQFSWEDDVLVDESFYGESF